MHLKNILCLQLPISLMIFTICPMVWSFSSKLMLMFLFMIRKFTIFTPTFDTGARIKPTILNFNLMEYYGPLSCDCSWKSLKTCFQPKDYALCMHLLSRPWNPKGPKAPLRTLRHCTEVFKVPKLIFLVEDVKHDPT